MKPIITIVLGLALIAVAVTTAYAQCRNVRCYYLGNTQYCTCY